MQNIGGALGKGPENWAGWPDGPLCWWRDMQAGSRFVQYKTAYLHTKRHTAQRISPHLIHLRDIALGTLVISRNT